MTHSCVSHDSFMCVTRLIQKCLVQNSSVMLYKCVLHYERPILYPKSPIFYQKSLIFYQKSLIFYQNSHEFYQKSPIFDQTSTAFYQKGLVFNRKSPTFNQTSLLFHQKSPIFYQNTPIFYQQTPIFAQEWRNRAWNVTNSSVDGWLEPALPETQAMNGHFQKYQKWSRFNGNNKKRRNSIFWLMVLSTKIDKACVQMFLGGFGQLADDRPWHDGCADVRNTE